MKKILIWSLILVLVAVVSVLGTIAYLSAVDEDVNVMVVDDARIEIVEYERVNTNDKNTNAVVKEFRENKPLIPSVVQSSSVYSSLDNDAYASFSADNEGKPLKAGYTYPIWDPDDIAHEIDKMVFVKNTGDCNVYVRLCFAFEAGNYVRIDRFKEMVHLNLNGDKNQWVWSWNDKLAEVDGTRCFIAWATYQKPIAPGELTDISLAQIALDYTAINDHAHAFGDTYDVKVFAQGIQSDGFASASAALSNGFDDTIPFKNVKFLEFTDLKNALHYLNADKNSTYLGGEDKESWVVNSITFGRTEDHIDKVKGYDGVFTANCEDDSSDYTAYTYYVPTSDGKYDIYVLADNWKIYAPDGSSRLFNNMKALTKVDTSNLDVSYVTNMFQMFHDCWALAEIDVSHWVVDNVTNMAGMFQVCQALPELDCSNWNVSNVTNMNAMFNRCNKLKTLDVSNWDVSSVQDMTLMFATCTELVSLNISGWNFGDDDTVSITNMNSMFNSCYKLEYIDVANWNVSKVTNMSGTFVGCYALKSLDVSRWNVGKATAMNQMFDRCYNLASLDVSKWNVSKVEIMSSMFQNASKLTELDLSSWNTANVLDSKSMFNNCVNLKTIYVGDGWNMDNVTVSSDMFKSCNQLPNYNASVVDKTNAHANTGGYLTKK